jgi:hypothetical protein
VPLIDFGTILPPKPKADHNRIANLEAEIDRKTRRLDDFADMDDIPAIKKRIRNLHDEITGLNTRLAEARRDYKIAEHADEDRIDQLMLTITALRFAPDDDRYLLRARIAQELRRIVEAVRLNDRREIVLVLKPSSGCRAEMAFRNEKFDTLRLTDIETGEVTEIDRLHFLLTMHQVVSSTGLAREVVVAAARGGSAPGQ